ncbi:hypothetical protein BJX68DRAFT_261871 [Aspergillus pseudodeflectus]|uniref:Ankyrin repeat-containing domain protein n=1 Tax=Aspergillus pseudodeflectus TaxID=176178 RepID=A0ABR4L4H6_9EURO
MPLASHSPAPQDLNELIQANKHLYTLLSTTLYKRNVAENEGSALMWASSHGRATTAAKSLAAGAAVDHSPFFQAAMNGHADVTALLVDAEGALGDDGTVKGSGRLTPLWLAAQQGHVEVVKSLVFRDGGAGGAAGGAGRGRDKATGDRGGKRACGCGQGLA